MEFREGKTTGVSVAAEGDKVGAKGKAQVQAGGNKWAYLERDCTMDSCDVSKAFFHLVMKEVEGGGCFPGHAEIRGKGAEAIRMDQLTVGSEIHVGTYVDKVTNFLHREADDEAPFLRLFTERGILEVTGNHLVFIKSPEGVRYAVLAETVRVGDMLQHRDGGAQVQSIEAFTATGFYAPLTTSGELEVNGFFTSCYASFPHHSIAHLMMLPLQYLPAQLSGIHWYARAWMNVHSVGKQVWSKLSAVIRRCTYPIVDLSPMLGFSKAKVVDVIS